MMQSYTFRTIIESDDPSGYHGFVPLLPGVHTSGETIEETRKNLKEAILCHLQGMFKDGAKIPHESESIEIIQSFTDKDLFGQYA